MTSIARSKPVKLVQHHHIERCRRGAFFLKTADVHSGVVDPVIGQAVDQVGITVIGKNHRPVAGEDAVEIALAKTVRMLLLRLQRHQIDDIDNANFKLRQGISKQIYRSQGFEHRNIASTGHHDIRLGAFGFATGPSPDPDTRVANASKPVAWQAIAARTVCRQRSR